MIGSISIIFYKILYMSLTGTIIGIISLCITKIFDTKISAKWKCIILLIPVLFYLIPINRIEINTNTNLKVAETIENVETSIVNLPIKNSENIIYHNESPEDKNINNQEVYHSNQSAKIDKKDIIPLIWLFGLILSLLMFIIGNLKLTIKINKLKTIKDTRLNLILNNCQSELRIKKNIPIKVQNKKESPCVYGIICPKILISKEIIYQDDEMISNIFMHELSHYKRKDMLTNILLLLVLGIHWFNPFAHILFQKVRQNMEIATDELATQKMNKDQRIQYGFTLINLLRLCQESNSTNKALCIADDAKNMKKRIKRIKKSSKFTHKKLIIALIFIIIGLLLIPFIIKIKKQMPNDEEPPKMMLEEAMSSKRTFITEKNEEKLFKEYMLPNGEYAKPDSYTFIDLDYDEVDELVVLTTANYGAYIILHLENNVIYGYELGIRSFEELKTNGTFMASSGAGYNEYYTLKFNKNTYEFIPIDEKQFLEAETEKFLDYVKKQDNNTNEPINIIGNWQPTHAEKGGSEVPLTEIYGTAFATYGGYLSLNEDLTYSKYIGAYSQEESNNYEGTYTLKDNKIELFPYNKEINSQVLTINNNNLLEEIDGYTIQYAKVNISESPNEENINLNAYLGEWVDDENENSITINKIEKNTITFDLSIFRTYLFSNITATKTNQYNATFNTSNSEDIDSKWANIHGFIDFTEDTILIKITSSETEDIYTNSEYIFKNKV